MKILISFIFCLIAFSPVWAQSAIQGKVTDQETGEELIGANISFKKNGDFIMGCVTDFDGNYKVNIDTGMYDVIMSYIGFPDKQINGVLVKESETTFLNIVSPDFPLTLDRIIICYFPPPIIDRDETTTKKEITSKTIQRTPTRSIKQLSSLTAGISFQN